MEATYARQSVDKKDSISIDTQIEFCNSEVPESERDKIKIYKDKGYSGKNTDRPDFQRLIEDIKKGIITKVRVYRLDRISRSLLDFANIMDIFNQYKVEFVSYTEKFDTSTPIGRAMLSIIMVFAQLERETIQQRVKDNYYERAKRGYFIGGSIAYGFDTESIYIDGIETKRLIPNANMKVVKWMFDTYNREQVSILTLIKMANELGYRSSNGNLFKASTIHGILKNPIYAKADIYMYNYLKSIGCTISDDISKYDGINGLIVIGNNGHSKWTTLEGYTAIVGTHKGEISGDVWVSVQEKFKSNRKLKNTGKSSRTWLSGLLKCAKCNYSMAVNTAYGGKKEPEATYLRCTHKYLTKGTGCNALSFKSRLAENLIETELLNYIKNLNIDIIDNLKEENENIEGIKERILIRETEISNLIQNIASFSNTSAKYIDDKIQMLDKELAELNNTLNKEIMNSKKYDYEKIHKLKESSIEWHNMNIEDKKEYAKEFINSVFIGLNDNELEYHIDWKY